MKADVSTIRPYEESGAAVADEIPAGSALSLETAPIDYQEYSTWVWHFHNQLIRLEWPTERFVRMLVSRLEKENVTDSSRPSFPEGFFQEFLNSYEAYRNATGILWTRKRDFLKMLMDILAQMPESLLSDFTNDIKIWAIQAGAAKAFRENPKDMDSRRKRDLCDLLMLRRNGFATEIARNDAKNPYVRFLASNDRLRSELSGIITVKTRKPEAPAVPKTLKRVRGSIGAILTKDLFGRN